MKQILITGASGFVGSTLVEEALLRGYKVLAGIRKSSSTKYLQHPDIQFVILNFEDVQLLTEQLQNVVKQYGNIDAVVHNAGLTQAKDEKAFMQVNHLYTQHFVWALEKAGIQLQKFVLISSLAAYGPGKDDFSPITIQTPYAPVTAYGKSKLAAEQFVQQQAHLPYIIINPTAVYGPRDKDLFQFIKLISKGWEPYLGTHQQMISLIHVNDLARAVIAVVGSSLVKQSFIVADGKAYNKEELGAVLKQILQKKTIRIKLPLGLILGVVKLVEKLFGLFGSRPFLNEEKIEEISSANWICESTIWEQLHIKPQYRLDNGMQNAVEWYKENGWL